MSTSDSQQTDHVVLTARASLKDLADEYERDMSDTGHSTTNSRGACEETDSTSPEVEGECEPEPMEQSRTSPKVVGKSDTAVDESVEDFALNVKEQLTMGDEISQEETTTR